VQTWVHGGAGDLKGERTTQVETRAANRSSPPHPSRIGEEGKEDDEATMEQKMKGGGKAGEVEQVGQVSSVL